MRRLVTHLGVMLVAMISMASFAHQQKTAITKVLFNPRTSNIEIMHRFYVHDAEHAVKEIFGKQADIIGSVETQEMFSQYVFERFSVKNENQQELTLTPVGFELEGKFLWVYQEVAQPDNVKALTVSHVALKELWPSQINTVNFEGNGKIKTLTFDENVELLKVEFETSH